MTSEKILSIEFEGASAKRKPFRGWVGKITDWPEKCPPKLRFGTWRTVRSEYGGGIAEICGMQPFELFMYGANSPKMRSIDKFTYFGYAGLTDEGNLRCIRLGRDQGDARTLWQTNGLLPRAQILLEAEAKAAILVADGRPESIENLFLLLLPVFKEWALHYAGFPRDGLHLDVLERLQARLPVIAASVAQLQPFLENISEFCAQWKEARRARRATRKVAPSLASSAHS